MTVDAPERPGGPRLHAGGPYPAASAPARTAAVLFVPTPVTRPEEIAGAPCRAADLPDAVRQLPGRPLSAEAAR
ncbi:hypothetical protein AB0G35_06280 [Streptomyces sp. NPDC021749]|uniref:hypothetical protein n=1 Tax=Streptomyces sp. NPDC021749 TaxID=3154905 RepID=UPI0034064E47